jgi:RNA polymerase-binding protein DksA
MNAAQLAFFKARLQQLEKDLLKNADETTEHLRETVLVPDPADRATIEEEHALELRTRDRERKLLKKFSNPSPASMKVTTAGAKKQASLSAFHAYWHVRQQRCHSKLSNDAK